MMVCTGGGDAEGTCRRLEGGVWFGSTKPSRRAPVRLSAPSLPHATFSTPHLMCVAAAGSRSALGAGQGAGRRRLGDPCLPQRALAHWYALHGEEGMAGMPPQPAIEAAAGSRVPFAILLGGTDTSTFARDPDCVEVMTRALTDPK
jgi:hypothetical protein